MTIYGIQFVKPAIVVNQQYVTGDMLLTRTGRVRKFYSLKAVLKECQELYGEAFNLVIRVKEIG